MHGSTIMHEEFRFSAEEEISAHSWLFELVVEAHRLQGQLDVAPELKDVKTVLTNVGMAI